MKIARLNISHFRFILFNLKIFSEIVTTLCLTSVKQILINELKSKSMPFLLRQIAATHNAYLTCKFRIDTADVFFGIILLLVCVWNDRYESRTQIKIINWLLPATQKVELKTLPANINARKSLQVHSWNSLYFSLAN